MKRLFRFLFLSTIGFAAASGAQTNSSGILLDSYSAIVNGKVITIGEVLDTMRMAQERLMAQYSGRELEEKIMEEYGNARNLLVESELILLDFTQQGITLPDRAIEDHINSVIHDRFNNDRTAFLRALADERLTYSEWRTQMMNQLISQLMRQKEVASKILITPFDIQTTYEANRAAYARPERVRLNLFVLPPDTQVNISRLDRRLHDGSLTFEQAAPVGTLQPGNEFIETAHLNPSIQAAIQNLPPGGISGAVEIEGSTYFIQVAERQEARIQPLDEVSADIERDLRRAEFERLNKIWMDSLRSRYFIQYFSHDLFN
ncbi:MAG: peptidyl-prolyl cis-trans isomerase [Verrucomicrobiota bacterium]|jgi:parvulin-like peptidyl-prolyl isomerase|nr:peptidyl-prolyl cis-trans isomerase [Verrucomicrobiota bacterium]